MYVKLHTVCKIAHCVKWHIVCEITVRSPFRIDCGEKIPLSQFFYTSRFQAQLILVANAANGVSVKFSNWEEFFPIEYV